MRKKVHKPITDVDAAWQTPSMDDIVKVCYGPTSNGSRAVMIDRDDKNKIKTMFVFLSSEAASEFIKLRGQGLSYGEVRLGFLIEKLREVYADEPDHQVRCVLTGLNKDGILHELDVLWQLIAN